MRIIKPSYEIWERDEKRGCLAIIERAGKLCYKSEPGKTPESAERFTRSIIQHQHNSVLEHGDLIFDVDRPVYDTLAAALQAMRDSGEQPPMLEMTRIDGRCIVSGNIRAWRELFASHNTIGLYFIGCFDPVYVQGYGFDGEEFIGTESIHVRQLHYADLNTRAEKLAHIRETVHFVCDRAIQNEFVRHRLMSFSVESSRYCCYTLGKFGQEITVIEPCFLEDGSYAYETWRDGCEQTEIAYFDMIMGAKRKAQEARDVLPLSVKTEMAMTGTLRAWDHFFDLRARQVTGSAHPQAVELALPLMREMAHRHPDVINAD